MSVVLRCPNCGTTKTSSGECEACHEAQVRYFCTNHAPGVWLDTSTCSQCGSRVGHSSPRVSASPPIASKARTSRPAASSPGRARAATSVRPPAYSREEAPESRAGAWRSRERLPSASEEEPDAMATRMPLWQQMLHAALRARSISPSGAPYGERPRIAPGVGGCLKRLVLLIVVLFIALVLAALLFGWALFQGL